MAIEIPLSRGKVALIDDEDLPLVSARKWCARPGKVTFYAQSATSINGKHVCFKMHRLILSAQPGQQVDHIDGNGLNNTRANIRLCTNAENSMNRRKQANTSSKYKGVFWKTDKKKWVADIYINGRCNRIGSFGCEADAARAYDAAAVKHFGQFARTNF